MLRKSDIPLIAYFLWAFSLFAGSVKNSTQERIPSVNATSQSTYNFRMNRTYFDSQMANLNTSLQTCTAIPAIEANIMIGMLLKECAKDSFFLKAGLLPGDTLKEINGKTLADFPKAQLAFRSMPGSKKLTIKVSRKGKDLIIHTNIVE